MGWHLGLFFMNLKSFKTQFDFMAISIPTIASYIAVYLHIAGALIELYFYLYTVINFCGACMNLPNVISSVLY